MNKKTKANMKYKVGKGVVQAWCPLETRRDFKVACAKSGEDMKDVLLKAVHAYIKEHRQVR